MFSEDDFDFTSFVAQNLKSRFDEKFSLYKSNLQTLHKFAPNQIFSNLEKSIGSFFN